MLFWITGASGSGKTSCLPDLQRLLPKATVVDFDDIGVPANPDKGWRQQSTEKWLKAYLANDNTDQPFCVCGQVVLGEILACPSANKIGKVHICLLDVADVARIDRLNKRNTYGADQSMLNWSAWLRMHHHNPQWHQDVIKENCWQALDFSCWESLNHWESLANITTIDTTRLSVNKTAIALTNWIKEEMQ